MACSPVPSPIARERAALARSLIRLIIHVVALAALNAILRSVLVVLTGRLCISTLGIFLSFWLLFLLLPAA